MERHFAFFSRDTGAWVREWKGPVEEPVIDPLLVGNARIRALIPWATAVAKPEAGEIGLDVTHIGWPVGDFCYCTFDATDRRLEWGPPRYYIEVDLATGWIVANQESHRPVLSQVPGQVVVDITGTALEPLHGRLFGRLVRRGTGLALEERPLPLLEEAPVDLLMPQLHEIMYAKSVPTVR